MDYAVTVSNFIFVQQGYVCTPYIAPGECVDGELRLADGAIEGEGRPEVCINGVWGSVCQYGWNEIDAFLFCSELGHSGPSTGIYNLLYCIIVA